MTKFIQSTNLAQVKKEYPAAARIVKVEGGYMVYENYTDFPIWKNQK